MSQYVARTTEQWRRLGLTYARVEVWNQYDRKNYDLFGFADYLLLTKIGICGVQIACAGSHALHRRKILAEPRARQWLESGGQILLLSWSKRKPRRGGKASIWVPRGEYIQIHDFPFQ